MAKGPKPRDFGLDSDHPTSLASYLSIDPAQPFSQDELSQALQEIIEQRALDNRRNAFARAQQEYRYNNGWVR
jgi:hypothetical protein